MTQQQSVKYIIAYGYNDKFYLTEEEAAAIVRATEEGKKIVKFSKRVFTTNFSWILPMEEVKSEENPILEDPEYQEYTKLKTIVNPGDGTLRRKMQLESIINKKYPYDRYAEQWEETKTSQSKALSVI